MLQWANQYKLTSRIDIFHWGNDTSRFELEVLNFFSPSCEADFFIKPYIKYVEIHYGKQHQTLITDIIYWKLSVLPNFCYYSASSHIFLMLIFPFINTKGD